MRGFVRWYHVVNTAVIGFLIVMGVLLVVVGPIGPVSAQATTNIRGWAWSGTTGWISLNSANCTDLNQSNSATPPCTVHNIPYGVDLVLTSKTAGDVRGYAWSENMGWLCFGYTCASTPPGGGAPDITFTCKNGAATVKCDALAWSNDTSGTAPSVNLVGWAKAINLPGNEGWVQLSGAPNTMNGVCNNDNTQVCTADAQCSGGTCSRSTWVKLFFERGVCSNDNSTICTTDAQCGLATCVASSQQGAGLGGWGWSYGGGGKKYGLGWISFNEQSPEVLFPYLQAQGGDVFSGSGVHTAFPPPSGQYNAKYLVHVNGSLTSDLSIRFRSECTDPVCRVKNYRLELPTDPTGDTPYTFKLGRFDFQGLISATAGKNRYGQSVVTLNETGLLPQVLNNKVYVVTPRNTPPTYTMSGLQLLNADNIVTTSGAGTIVVRGDLEVNGDITYPSDVSVSRQRLASVTWIVLGDVKLGPNVANLAGTFIVLGRRKDFGTCQAGTNAGAVCTKPSDCNSNVCAPSGFGVCVDPGTPLTACTLAGGCANPVQQCIPWLSVTVPNACVSVVPNLASPNTCVSDSSCVGGGVCRSKCLLKDGSGDLYSSCGRFVTGVTSTTPLTVSGSVFARQFKLERTFVDPVSKTAAERFVADGRLQLNPPPGMIDFAKGLPLFRRQ